MQEEVDREISREQRNERGKEMGIEKKSGRFKRPERS